MTSLIVICGDLSGRETVTRTIRLPAMRAAPHFERAGRTSAIFVTSVVARVRGMSGTGAWNHGRHASTPSAASIPLGSAIRSDFLFPATVIAGSLLPFWRGSRLFLNSVGPFQAARRLSYGLSFSIALQACKQSARRFSKAFHFNPFCRLSGLVAAVERHDSSERKIPNGGNSGARPGNLTARDGNA